ncbi:hypothetical protein Pen02_06650 [Plantactinospora endophytica]|uniref:PPE family domain-containing protein n=1 Tax=Plantactinospora endophytica TaxID=673535 RepID=A0ABQ4DTH3_9ACTN|nr:hypothetical protein Pen02_06650 [Plantactinospora endophytica]
MLDDGGGGSGQISGTTNWTSQNVPQMWALLANQQTDTHWQHVSGWRKTSELSSLHLSRLKQYRDNLMEAWPPERSEASRAYVSRLDYLIQTVQGVYDTAVANQQTLTGVTQALWEYRRDLEEINREYEAKAKAKEQYDAAVLANNGKPPTGQQPTTQADLEDLNWRGRHVMYGLSSELATAQVQLRKPPVYKNPKGSKDESESGGGSGGSSAMGGSSPPVLPPVVPMPAGGGASYSPPPTPAIHTVVPTPPAPSTGPILGGTGPIAPPAVPPTPPSVIPPPPPTTGPGLPPPPVPPGLPPGTRPPGMPSGAKPPGLSPGYPTTSVMPPGTGPNKAGLGPNVLGPRAMPPGGLIGGAPGTGLSQPTAGTGGARRINPVGGVIGGSGSAPIGSAGVKSSMGAGRSAMGTSHAYGMGSGSRASSPSREEENSRHWDPDNPWETDEGVAPVVMPTRENGRIDPGPAIGYKR